MSRKFLELGRKGVHGHELERFRELGITDIDDVVAYTQSHLWSGEIESYPEAGYQDCEEILELDAAGISGVLAEHLAEEGIAGTAACKQALSDTALNNVDLRRGSATGTPFRHPSRAQRLSNIDWMGPPSCS